MWGGLKPIRTRFLLDVLTLIALGYCVLTPTSSHFLHISILVLSCGLTFMTAGITRRWTISLFLAPIVVLQLLRHCVSDGDGDGDGDDGDGWVALTFKIVSFTLIASSFLMTILFPAVKLNKINGEYNVGIIDLHIPVETESDKDCNSDYGHTHTHTRSHVSVRLLYPTRETSVRIPYFNVETSDKTCKALMTIAAPPPLNKLNFMLDQWKFSTIWAKRNAVPFIPNVNLNIEGRAEKRGQEEKKDENLHSSTSEHNDCQGLPIVVFSHGIIGSAELYSYQTLSLAASGSLVMSINHSDGSAIGIQQRDGSFLEFDSSIGKMARKRERYAESVKCRRKQLNHRTSEFIGATKALLMLNERNIPELDSIGISFVNKLKKDDCIAAGHSFGGATALTAAHRRTDLFSACIAHDPAFDWCPDDTRKALLAKDRLVQSKSSYNGGTGGYENGGCVEGASTCEGKIASSIHDLDLFFLYSGEWKELGWGEYQLFRNLFRRGLLGREHGTSDFGFVYNAYHSEFSDSCMKLPLWLARIVKTTGIRNPHETAEEISSRTATFIAEVRKHHDAPKEKNQ